MDMATAPSPRKDVVLVAPVLPRAPELARTFVSMVLASWCVRADGVRLVAGTVVEQLLADVPAWTSVRMSLDRDDSDVYLRVLVPTSGAIDGLHARLDQAQREAAVDSHEVTSNEHGTLVVIQVPIAPLSAV